MISLSEAKMYLRVDAGDEDGLIITLLDSARAIVSAVARTDLKDMDEDEPTIRAAVLYTLAYLYEHREEADYHELNLMLRDVLTGVRKAAF